jgi:tetratricopeptide (TPR) repeat protein
MQLAPSELPSHHVYAALADDLTWFFTCKEIRLLHVTMGSSQRDVVLAQLALAEGHGANRSPFFVLEDAHTKDDPGWLARAERISVVHDTRRAAMASEGYRLDAIEAVSHSDEPLLAFSKQLGRCLYAQREVNELDGLVVVLAPTLLEEPKAFTEAVLALLRAPAPSPLTHVRFVVASVRAEDAEPFVAALGDAAMTVRCVVDPKTVRREQAETLSAAVTAGVDEGPEARMGGAGPSGVTVPACSGKPKRDAVLDPDQQAVVANTLGAAATLLGAPGALLRQRILGAALAVQEQRFEDAVALQTAAHTQCVEANMVHLACIVEVTLAAYLLHAGDPARARVAFENAALRASDAGLLELAVQAHLGLAALLVLQKNVSLAVSRYAEAGELAIVAKSPLLAIEAYRTAGQVALQAHAEEAATKAWQRALEVARDVHGASPALVQQSSAPLAARALAKVLQNYGSYAVAESLLKQADDYERGTSHAG